MRIIGTALVTAALALGTAMGTAQADSVTSDPKLCSITGTRVCDRYAIGADYEYWIPLHCHAWNTSHGRTPEFTVYEGSKPGSKALCTDDGVYTQAELEGMRHRVRT